MTRMLKPDRPGDNPGRILVGMSGGVDSSVASLLLQRQGWHVTGLTLATHDGSWSAVADARAVCAQLGIELIVADVRERFRRLVIEPFQEAWLGGLTPNPCIRCNPWLKFAVLLEEAARLGCTALATGHYAAICRHPQSGRLALARTQSGEKDQSYFLSQLTQQQLAMLVFPLAGLEKQAVRQIAAEAGLVGSDRSQLAVKPDSQDICFVPDGDYAALLYQNIAQNRPAEAVRLFEPGPVADESGQIIGCHRGLIHYTIGQRKGFSVRTTERLFVIALQPERQTLVVGPFARVLQSRIRVIEIVWSGASSFIPGQVLHARVRSSAKPVPCRVQPGIDGALDVHFAEPVAAPTPGQICVFYEQDLIMAAGMIDRWPEPAESGPADG